MPGNTSNVTTVEKIRANLKGWNLARVLFVANAGMNSEHNRKELAKACRNYLPVCRMSKWPRSGTRP